MDDQINAAVLALRSGGVIAYPTEYCFGLGCDPRNPRAIERLLKMKRRQKYQGVILIAASTTQVEEYARLSGLPRETQVLASWPGPNTWVIPSNESVSEWVRGKHPSVAMRISAHSLCQTLCKAFGHAIVSTSANRHGQAALLNSGDVNAEFKDELDYVINAPVGNAKSASTIRDALTGKQLR